jgi:hypothetical protein
VTRKERPAEAGIAAHPAAQAPWLLALPDPLLSTRDSPHGLGASNVRKSRVFGVSSQDAGAPLNCTDAPSLGRRWVVAAEPVRHACSGSCSALAKGRPPPQSLDVAGGPPDACPRNSKLDWRDGWAAVALVRFTILEGLSQ